MTVREVKAAIRRGNDSAEEGGRILRQLGAQTAEAAALARETLHDSQDEDVDAGLQLLVTVEDNVNETIDALRKAVGQADTLAQDLG